MILLLSGEGQTDLGNAPVSGACGDRFIPGPIAKIAEHLLLPFLQFEIFHYAKSKPETVHLVKVGFLSELCKKIPAGTPILIPEVKVPKGGGIYRKQAQVLGTYALELSNTQRDDVVVLFFRDADGTNASHRTEADEKRASIKNGFDMAGFRHGVPVVPKPKSEAWLLCWLNIQSREEERSSGRKRGGRLKNATTAIGGCAGLEDLSGNDASPNSPKRKLEEYLEHAPSNDEMCGWITDGRVDPTKIDMPSFNAFKSRLEEVLTDIGLARHY